MDTRVVAVSCAAGLLGLLFMYSFSPDTGPGVAAAPVVTARPPPVRATPRPVAATAPGVMPGIPVVPPTRTVAPLPPIDPDQVHVADLKGLATAAVARRLEFAGC